MENKKTVPQGKLLQIMSLTKGNGWKWFTVSKDLQDACLQECIAKRKPYQLIDATSTAVYELDLEEIALELHPKIVDHVFNTSPIDINEKKRIGFIKGANWQQSQSIEVIVGFVLDWVAERIPHKDWKISVNGEVKLFDEILIMKSDIIKEYNNGK